MDATITAVSILKTHIKHDKNYVGSVGLEPTISCVMSHSVSFQFSSYPYPLSVIPDLLFLCGFS